MSERRSYRKINRMGLDGYELLVHLEGVNAPALVGTVLREGDAKAWVGTEQLMAACEAVLECPIGHDEYGHAVIRVPARSVFDVGALVRSALALAKGTT